MNGNYYSFIPHNLKHYFLLKAASTMREQRETAHNPKKPNF